MNFKLHQAQNQRLEQITVDHLIIGIDIAKETHVARAVNWRGIEHGRYISFTNDRSGFERFLHWVQELQKSQHKTSLIMGLEPTGHYWFNLANWLLEKQVEVVMVNPSHVKRNKENRDNSPTKNDIKDSLVIADMVRNGYYSTLRMPAGPYKKLRDLMTMWTSSSDKKVALKNQIHRWIDIWFPEYSYVFKTWTCKTSMAILREFSLPSEIVKLTNEEIVTGLRKHVKRVERRFIPLLVVQAKRSIGCREGLDEAQLSLQMLLEQYDLLTTQMGLLEIRIAEQMDQIPVAKQLMSITKIPFVPLAGILAEGGDLSQLNHGQQLLRLAGLHLSESSSGKHKGQVKITKRGRSGLRRWLHLAVMLLVCNNAEFKALHKHNVHVKKMKKLQSILKLTAKLARILVGISRNKNSLYDVEQIQIPPLKKSA